MSRDTLDALLCPYGDPPEENHKYGIGQPIYFKPEHSFGIHSAFIAIRFYRGLFGDWHIEMVEENNICGKRYKEPEDHMTDECPVLHTEHSGTVYLTGNGRPLKSIRGGF